MAVQITGALNREVLERSLTAIVGRHETLRTRFVSVDGNPAQVVDESAAVTVTLSDLTGIPKVVQEVEVERLLAAEARRPFNLAEGPLMRCALVRLEMSQHILVVNIHHIATDAWSMGIFFRELAVCYKAYDAGDAPSLPELPIQYADYAVWQREWLQGDVLERQLAYWKQRLAGAKEYLELPTDRPRLVSQTFRGSMLTFPVREKLAEGLKQLSRREGVTLFMTLLAAFKALLHRYSKQEDILVGAPIAGRSRIETEGNIGFFINTLVLRTDAGGNPMFKEFLQRVRDVAFGAFEHQDLPFEKLVEELHPERSAGPVPLIQAMFVLQNAPGKESSIPNLTLSPMEVRSETAKFDLTLFFDESGKELNASLEYNTDLFDEATIVRMWGHLETLMEGIVADPAQRLSELPLLTDRERRQLLHDWNQTGRDYPGERSVHELFEEQVRQRPESNAIAFREERLTYGQLNARANQLAHCLRRAGVKPGTMVGLCMGRSLEMIVGLLGILKAGGAYAALDPALPKERLAGMIEDLKMPVLVIQPGLVEALPENVAQHTERKAPLLICLDAGWEAIAEESTEDPPIEVVAESPAYVSFTSGSTGRPKGVCVPHRGVVRLVKNTNYANFSAEEVFLQLAPISFDASTLEVWGALLNGGRLVVMPPNNPSLSDLGEVIQREKVTTLWLTSGFFNQMIEEKPDGLRNLRQILVGGDVLSAPHIRKALSLLPITCRLINGYGPTENTTFSTCYPIPLSFSDERSVPIGRPIANSRCYVLDEYLQPVPIGVPGELYVGGDGLALGYLNQPELTAEKFVADPFQPGARLYRTGDKVRYLADGNIDFLGRIDLQVKIRGFRVELGEVESVLAAHPSVSQCVVTAEGGSSGGRQLVAYVVLQRTPAPTVAEWRQYLKLKLPDYMIPVAFLELEKLPLTANGKVDRRALPETGAGRNETKSAYEEPRDEMERQLKDIWETVLGIKPIGVEDKFFELGGHSLLAVRLVAQVEKKIGRKMPVAAVFQAATVRQMAEYLRQGQNQFTGSSVVEIQGKGTRPPLFFVHGVGGGMFWGYTNLSRSLGPDQPVYALKSRSMDGHEEYSRIEEMATRYVADLRALQPKGPYHLGGYCFGGDVAYEMARQLEEAGEKVAMLAVMNCAPPNSGYSKFHWDPLSIVKFLRNVGYLIGRSLKWGSQQRREFLVWKALLTKRKIMRLFQLSRNAVSQINVDDIVDLSSFPPEQRILWETHVKALINFFPRPYAGKVTLFRSRGHPLFCSYDSKYGWSELAGNVEVHIVPGAHESILEFPHVRMVAEKLNDCMAKLPCETKLLAELQGAGATQQVTKNGVPAKWNETQADYPAHLCVQQLFEEQANKTPDATALICEGREFSYAEINQRANQLAHHLRSAGVGPDAPVGICLERSAELVVGLLGILKAGGAYVPLDPAYPKERLAVMLEDSKAPMLVTQKKFAGTLPSGGARVVCLDQELPAGLSDENPVVNAKPDSLAYIIYTSGSTGKPKGVAMRHRPLVNLIWWQLKNSTMGKGDRTLQFSSASFDVSFQEIFSTFCSGGTLMMISEDLRHDPAGLMRFLREQKVNRFFLPFIALNQLTECFQDSEPLPVDLREIVTAGEQLRVTAKMVSFFERLPGCTLHNHYGPSESHVVTAYTLSGAPADWPALPSIGTPIANTQIHLLDDKMHPVPVGEAGELYIGGDCLARGYLHRPDLTSERFVSDPFRLEPDARLYKTGDLARYDGNGNIEYLGRIDQQVKIRGYRVELSEVESVLGVNPIVRECAVTAREDVPGQRRLVAYVVPQPGQKPMIGDLRQGLQEKLPDYMVPSAFVFLDALPLTPSGKVNRLALPAPDQSRPDLGSEFVAPSDEAEEKIAAIWREVLNLKQIGTRDNFFELGGQSLLAAQVISRVREYFKVELPVTCLYDAPTVTDLAEGIRSQKWGAGQAMAPAIEPIPRTDNLPLSFGQRRLWFIDHLEPGSHAYNVPMAVHLEGALNVNALRQSLSEIVRRHEALRTTVSFADGNLAQTISPEHGVNLKMIDLQAGSAMERAAKSREMVAEEARRSFDLEKGPLLRCTLLRLDEKEHILVIVMHHIISDGWSLGVLLDELHVLYNALAEGKPMPVLPLLPIQYADYAGWQQKWMQGPVLDAEVSYWKVKLQDAPPSIELPVDHIETSESRAAQSTVVLPKTLMDAMTALSRREGITPFMVMMAGLALTLNRWTEQSDLVIGTVVAGRNRRELENLIGCFMNFVPVRTKVNGNQSVREFLTHVKETVLEAHAHQECPFEKIVEAINPERRLAENPLYNVGLLVQNFSTGKLGGGGLKAKLLPVDLQAALLDLRFIAEDCADGMSLACEYKGGMFEPETIEQLLNSFTGAMELLTREPEKRIADFAFTDGLAAQAQTVRGREGRQTIAIAATFTAEPVEDSLKYWMREVGIASRVEFAPYNQVFQQLLDPGSVFASNRRGVNVVLIRLQDWEKFEGADIEAEALRNRRVNRNAQEFIAAVKGSVSRGSTPYLICLCPGSKSINEQPGRSEFYRKLEQRLADEMERTPGVYLVTTAELERLYPVPDYEDPHSEELGNIPYKPEFFAGLGTMIARKIHALKRPAYKAIVLDCDQTLWAGVCGEDGPKGIQIDGPRHALQQFMHAQHDAGMLLCITSKNSEEDVNCVFEQRREMPLQKEHFAASRINWEPKSKNIRELAKELRLGLDSFIFVDDNPVECAEVEANCPEVLTLLLPEPAERILQFLNHCWAFDHLKLSAEDRRRAVSYRQEREREQFRAESMSLGNFLDGLNLKVEIAALSGENLTRAAQLTMRTNQFNFTTRRRTESELQSMLQAKTSEVLTVSVSDRFGAYGIVGLIVYGVADDAIDVDTFLLSCRVLGRGVECQMIERLGKKALSRGLSRVGLHFVPSTKNQPAFNFLEKAAGQFQQALNGGYVYRLPAEYAAAVNIKSTAPEVPKAEPVQSSKADTSNQSVQPTKLARYRWIALEADEPDTILQLIEKKSRTRSASGRDFTAPGTETEKLLCQVWEKLLRVERVGINDNFFELGGHSMLAVRLFAEVEKATGRKLPLVTLFHNATVKQLADVLSHIGTTSRSSMVMVQGPGTKPPLFLIHGAGGDVLWGYANLASHLGEDQPVYGVKSRALNGEEEFTSIEEMATFYIEQLRGMQPKGPYYLGGYCFGGNVAYEMARQFDAQGEEVALVALLDAAPMNQGYEQMRWWRPDFWLKFNVNLTRWLRDFFKMKPEAQHEFIFRKGRALRRKLFRKIAHWRSKSREVDLEEVIDLSKFPEHELKLWQKHLNMLNEHVSQPYSGKVTLFRTRGQPMFCSLEEDFGWSRLVKGEVEIKMIRGSHESIFTEPDVRALAEKLKNHLTENSTPATQEKSEVKTL